MTTAFPLAWPEGRKRTRFPKHGSFRRATFGYERDDLLEELRRLRARNVVLSTNLKLRQDGLPYSSQAQPADRGVAVYFTVDKEQFCFACDQWLRIEHNVRAIMKTIEALRGIARWGTGDMMRRAFRGFAALPPTSEDWRVVLGLGRDATLEDVKSAHRALAIAAHPDRGGKTIRMQKLNAAREAAERELS